MRLRSASLALTLGLVFAAGALAPAAHAAGRCGAHPWCDRALTPERRAALLLAAMTQAEKVALLGGDDARGVLGGDHAHTGTQTGIPRLDVPTVLYADGPLGPRQGKSTGLPAPIALAATWSRDLAGVHGAIAAEEARAKGNDALFGPAVNIVRTPLGGRTYEYYGEDPFLAGRLAVPWTRAVQGAGLLADVKHFAVNNQEGEDLSNGDGQPDAPLGAGGAGNRYFVNVHLSERALREIYLPQFEAAVKEGGAATVMCAYNRVNGPYACENHHLLGDVLRRDWGFDGYVIADYGAAHDTAANLRAGLDFEPWPPAAYPPAPVLAALASGQVSAATLDERVRNMLRTWFRFGLFDRAGYRDDDAQIDKPAHARGAERIEESAVTLLRNTGAVLPLDARRLKSIAVIGKPATSFITGGGSGKVTPFRFVSVLDAIRARAGAGVSVSYSDGSDPAAAAAAAKAADAVLVVAGAYYTEGADRLCLSLECPRIYGDQDGLISAVAAANPRTVVLLETGGPVLMPWRSKVAGIVEGWYPGGVGATSIARVLFGDADPGGRLPVTFPAADSQLSMAGDRTAYPGDADVFYKEDVLVGYRSFDARRVTPAYPFGFGLSYTRSSFGPLTVLRPSRRGQVARVRLRIRNTGRRRGVVVPQLYVGMPEPRAGIVQPPWQLKGFTRRVLAPGQTRTVIFGLYPRALSFWDERANGWRVAPGCYRIAVGRSSRDLPRRAAIARGGARCR